MLMQWNALPVVAALRAWEVAEQVVAARRAEAGKEAELVVGAVAPVATEV